jgi:hypothetical protein
VALSRNLSVVRYLELPSLAPPLTVTPPLRILAMVAGPSDLPALDVTNERQRMETAIASLVAAGLVELTWLASGSWRELQRAMRDGPWHIFHFIGHGGFAENIDEGVLVFVGDDGRKLALRASQVGRLLADHPSLRLVVLNSCEGAEGSKQDLVSSTAATLVQRGIPAVIAMQYEITDEAAIEFSRSLYEALADELPVDAAVAEARIAVSVALRDSIEWGTPVLFMRAAEGALFRLDTPRRRHMSAAPEPPAPVVSPPPSGAPRAPAPAESAATPPSGWRRWRALALGTAVTAVVLLGVAGILALRHGGTRSAPAVATSAAAVATAPVRVLAGASPAVQAPPSETTAPASPSTRAVTAASPPLAQPAVATPAVGSAPVSCGSAQAASAPAPRASPVPAAPPRSTDTTSAFTAQAPILSRSPRLG